WSERPALPDRAGQQRLLLLADRSGFARRVAQRLAQEGRSCELIERKGDVQAALRADEPARVVSFWGLDLPSGADVSAGELMAGEEELFGDTLALLQRLSGTRARLWLVTANALGPDAEGHWLSLGQTPLVGFARSVGLELSELWGGHVDIDPTLSDGAIE